MASAPKVRQDAVRTASQGNLDFVAACLNGLIAYHAMHATGKHPSRCPMVEMKIGVNASMLYRDDSRNAEMTIVFLNQGNPFLLVSCGAKWPETVAYAVMERGVIENPSGVDFEPLWGKPCRPDELHETIRAALEKHVAWKIASWQDAIQKQEMFLKGVQAPVLLE